MQYFWSVPGYPWLISSNNVTCLADTATVCGLGCVRKVSSLSNEMLKRQQMLLPCLSHEKLWDRVTTLVSAIWEKIIIYNSDGYGAIKLGESGAWMQSITSMKNSVVTKILLQVSIILGKQSSGYLFSLSKTCSSSCNLYWFNSWWFVMFIS